MSQKSFTKISHIFIGVLFLAFGLFGISRLHLHSAAPFQWGKIGSQIVVTGTLPEKASQQKFLLKGDRLLKIADCPIHIGREIDFVLDNSLPGEKLPLIVQRGEKIFSISPTIIQRFNKRFIIINLLLGLLFWIVGVFVCLSKPLEKAARVFFWGYMTLSAAILCNWPGYVFDIGLLGYVQPVLYLIIYPLLPTLILYFTMVYPTEKKVLLNHKHLPLIIFVPCLVFIVLLEATYLPAIHLQSIKHYINYIDFYNAFRMYLLLYLIISLGFFIHSYKNSVSRESRDKIRWILWGMGVGVFPFLFLWTIPIILGISPFIPEEVNYIFLMVVPLAFGFSIVKYQALDIQIVINRSIVYVIITGIIAGLYLTIVGFSGQLLHSISRGTGSFLIILFTLLAAALFAPLKNRIQIFVDKTFYRVKYNYRLAIKDFSDAITSVPDQNQVLDLINKKINDAIPIEKMVILMPDTSARTYRVIASQGLNENELLDIRYELKEGLADQVNKSRRALVKAGRAEFSDFPKLPVTPGLDRLGIELIIPVILQEKIIGLLVFGKKMSGMRYSDEDIELLTRIASQGFETVARMKTQETIIMERADKEKLKELSDLKSEFISHISHELRTPLTSIQWSIENLLDGIPEQPGPKTREYLEGIHDSSQHLGRMIENLLDVSRIESGRIEIFLESINVQEEVEKVLEILKPFADKKHIHLKATQAADLWVKADRDRLREILTNLLDNAIKFSNRGDEVAVTIEKKIDKQQATEKGKEMVSISVIDHGPGIPKDKQEVIFERFERIKKDKAVREKGLGLGLHIVKKLVELQGGRIWVESGAGKGSVFTFVLPEGGKD